MIFNFYQLICLACQSSLSKSLLKIMVTSLWSSLVRSRVTEDVDFLSIDMAGLSVKFVQIFTPNNGYLPLAICGKIESNRRC